MSEVCLKPRLSGYSAICFQMPAICFLKQSLPSGHLDLEHELKDRRIMEAEQRIEFFNMVARGMAIPPRTPILRKPDEMGLDFEEVTFPATDGLELKAWYIPSSSNNLIICNHFSPANRYGYAGHIEPWNTSGGFEVNFIPKYKALHDAGYNVLVYDMRYHGESPGPENGVCGVGYFEWKDVLGSLHFARTWEQTSHMKISLQSMCMGANATLRAMESHPEDFDDVICWTLIQPLNGRTFVERVCENMHIDLATGIGEFDKINQELTGLNYEDHYIRPFIKSVKIPTLMLQVRNDMNSRASDIQEMYNDLEVEKDIIWVDDTPWRFHGYTYFSEHPEQMVAWYDKYMK